jgi:hypothetical protein
LRALLGEAISSYACRSTRAKDEEMNAEFISKMLAEIVQVEFPIKFRKTLSEKRR